MIFKLIIFTVLGITIYRFLGGKVPILDYNIKPNNPKEPDELDECLVCGTYTLVGDGVVKHDKFYCSTECAKSKV